MNEPTRIGSVVMATLRDRPELGRVSWTRVGPAEPETSEEYDYTPWVETRHVDSGRYFHRNDEGAIGVPHSSWDQFEDDAELSGPVGDALAEIMRSGGVDGAHHKQWTLDRIVRILTESPMVPMVNNHTANGVPYHFEDYGEGPGYLAWVKEYEGDPADPENYYGDWDRGIAP